MHDRSYTGVIVKQLEKLPAKNVSVGSSGYHLTINPGVEVASIAVPITEYSENVADQLESHGFDRNKLIVWENMGGSDYAFAEQYRALTGVSYTHYQALLEASQSFAASRDAYYEKTDKGFVVRVVQKAYSMSILQDVDGQYFHEVKQKEAKTTGEIVLKFSEQQYVQVKMPDNIESFSLDPLGVWEKEKAALPVFDARQFLTFVPLSRPLISEYTFEKSKFHGNHAYLVEGKVSNGVKARVFKKALSNMEANDWIAAAKEAWYKPLKNRLLEKTELQKKYAKDFSRYTYRGLPVLILVAIVAGVLAWHFSVPPVYGIPSAALAPICFAVILVGCMLWELQREHYLAKTLYDVKPISIKPQLKKAAKHVGPIASVKQPVEQNDQKSSPKV